MLGLRRCPYSITVMISTSTHAFKAHKHVPFLFLLALLVYLTTVHPANITSHRFFWTTPEVPCQAGPKIWVAVKTPWKR
ncbi:unnamed protein product [Choristocarpus tenellus]